MKVGRSVRSHPRGAPGGRHTLLKVAVAGALAMAAIAGIAGATIPGSDGEINGCYDVRSGQLRIYDPQGGQIRSCSRGETPLSWNQVGPSGEQGPAGPPGPPGPPGTVSLASLDGSPCTRSNGDAGTVLATVDADDRISLTCVGPPATDAAFQFTDLDLRDPHLFVDLPTLGLTDITDFGIAGLSFNALLQTELTTDSDGDGFLDLALVNLFRPLDQSAAATAAEIHVGARCGALPATGCAPGPTPTSVTATNQTLGACLGPIAGTTTAFYSPSVPTASPPCFSTSAVTVTLDLLGIPLTLRDAQVGATYVGDPATGESNGLLVGFLSEADADATVIPDGLAVIGGLRLSQLLPGGTGNPAGHSDMDVHEGVPGWWVYFAFTAEAVGWAD